MQLKVFTFLAEFTREWTVSLHIIPKFGVCAEAFSDVKIAKMDRVHTRICEKIYVPVNDKATSI